MAFFVLSILFLLLLGPAYARDCPGSRPADVCETRVGTPAPDPRAAEATARKLAPHNSKIHPAIAAMVSAIEVRRSAEAVAGLRTLSTELVRVNDAGEIQVYVILSDFEPSCVSRLRALGLRVEVELPRFRLVQGWVPSGAVDAVAALDCVRAVKPPAYPAREGAGAVSTAGDDILGASAARSAFNVTGAGVMVGVISDGVDHLVDSVQTGDLPLGVQVLQAGSGDEGTAMLEIVHDIAPGSPLGFYGIVSSADMVNGIDSLAAAGAKVVVDDVSFFSEPKFQDGMIAQTARGFATGGRVYVTAAGNRALQHYRAPYNRLTGQGYPSSAYPAVHNFGSGGPDIGNTLLLPPGCSLTAHLQWNNPFGVSADDFDLVIGRSSDLAVLAASTAFQTGDGDPYEAATFSNNTGTFLIVFIAVAEFQLTSPPESLILDFFALESCTGDPGLQYVTPSESLPGNHAVEEALPVAALGASTPTVAEPYSSQGPASISFPVPAVRNVPALSGIDCVATETGELGFFFLPFCGTSAAAPHVAGVAALLIERVPTASSEQLRAMLTGTALDLGPPGFDTTYGFGRVNAFAALQSASANPSITLGLALDHHTVAPGDLLNVTLSGGNAGAATSQDLYFVVLVPQALSASLGCPAGDAVVFLANGFAITVLCSATAPPQQYAPLYGNRVFPASTPSSPISTFSVVWPPGMAAGTYTFAIFTASPGAFADGNVGAADVTAVALDSLEASP
jgi:hypothetical protein